MLDYGMFRITAGLALAGITLLPSCTSDASSAADALSVRQRVLNATARVELPTSRGTAFAIRTKAHESGVLLTHWITAAHCVPTLPDGSIDSSVPVRLTLAGEDLGLAMVESVHPELDVAVLSTTTTRVVLPLRVSTRRAVLGEEVYTCGYAGGNRRYLTEGHVSGDGAASTSSYPGHSGGPVVSASGEVIGVLTMLYRTRYEFIQHAALFEQSCQFSDWLSDLRLI